MSSDDRRRGIFEQVGQVLDALSSEAMKQSASGGLREMLRAGNPTLVWAALQELGRVGRADLLEEIAPLLDHPDGTVRQAAEEAIRRIEQRAGGSRSASRSQVAPPLPFSAPVQVRPRPKYVPPPVATAEAPPPPPPPPAPAQRPPAPPPPPPSRPAAPPQRPAAAPSRTQQAVRELLTSPTEMGGTQESAAPAREARAATAGRPEQSAHELMFALPPPADLVMTPPPLPEQAPPSLSQPPLPTMMPLPELDWEQRPEM